MITGVGREAMTASMKLQAFIFSIQIDGKQKQKFRKSTFYCSLPN